MADTPTPLPTTDQAASVADSAVTLAVNSAETAAETAIIAADPVMATPVLEQLWEAILKFLFGYLGGFLAKGAGFVVVDVQEYFALRKAASALAALQAAQQSGDQNAITQASAGMDAAVAPVLHYIGSVQS